MNRIVSVCSGAALAAAFASVAPAQALSMKDCGAKYQEAKKADTLKGQKWNDFRKTQCGDDDVSAAEAAAAEKDEPAKTATAAGKSAPSTTATTSAAGKFPTAVSQQYASESPGKARMHTCLDQYKANKAATGGVAEMKWIEKGGGYYAQCNAKLKS